jgi:hypothetical protein
MPVTKSQLYAIVFAGCMAAGMWLYWNMQHYHAGDSGAGINMCLFKRVTGIPCPSCGTTRSLLYISRLDVRDACYANPFGFILAASIILFPFWVLYDIIARKNSFYTFYRNTELLIRKRWVAISLICIVAANWFWNIYKYY